MQYVDYVAFTKNKKSWIPKQVPIPPMPTAPGIWATEGLRVHSTRVWWRTGKRERSNRHGVLAITALLVGLLQLQESLPPHPIPPANPW